MNKTSIVFAFTIFLIKLEIHNYKDINEYIYI